MKKLLAMSAALAIAATGFVGVSSAQAAGTTLTYGVIADVTNWEASHGEHGNRAPLYQAAYDELLYQQPNGTIVPNLALSATYNKAQTVLTLQLRKGVKFSNGEAFTSAAVVKNLLAYKNGDGVGASLASSVKSVKAKGPLTVVITLSDVDPAFVQNLTGPMGMQQAPKTIGTAAAKSTPVGAGPYVMDTANSVPGSSYVFKSNPTYWNKKARHYGTVIFKVITDNTAAVNALKSGQVDCINLMDFSSIPSLTAAGIKIETQQLDWSGITLVDKAGRMGSPLKDVRIRQAINYALDRNALLQIRANGNGVPTSQVFASYSKGYDKSLNNYYPYDLAKAKQLMKDAGYEKGFTVSMPMVSALGATIWTAIKDQLGAIGITVDYSDVPFNNYFTSILTPKFPLYWMQLERNSNDWAFLKFLLVRDAIWNPSGYGTAQSDALINTIQHSSGAVQVKALKALNKYVVQQAWFAPFFASDMKFAHKSSVKVKLQGGNAVPYLFNISPA